MEKINLKENINQIKKISSKMPKTINEAINFGEQPYEEEEPMRNRMEHDEPFQKEMNNNGQFEMQSGNEEKARKLIDNIRKQALRAMADLADNPESPEYENLKRIWSLCDRAVSEKQDQKEVLQKNGRA